MTERRTSTLLTGGEPFLFPGGPMGCLLVHGFTGTPHEMRWLGEHLASQGHAALGVRLFGHATQQKDMNRARFGDWIASVEDGYCMLRGYCEKVVVIGLSLGGVLAMVAGERLAVDGVVVMASPWEITDAAARRLHYLIPAVSKILRYMPKEPLTWHDPEAEKVHVEYPRYPVRAVAELTKTINEMRANLGRITAPTLLVYSEGDTVVPAEHAERIFQHLGTKDKTLEWVTNSSHVISCDAERERVFSLIDTFVKRVGSTP